MHSPQIDLHGRSAAARCQNHGRSARREAGWHLLPPLFAAGVFVIFTAFLLYRSGAILTVTRLALLFGGAAVVIMSGQLLTDLVAPRPFGGRLVIATIIGYAVSTAALLFGVFICGVDVVKSFAAWSLVVAIASALTWQGTWRSRRIGLSRELIKIDLVMLAVPAAVVCFFCWDMAAAVPSIERTGVLPLCSDYFIHGADIAQFGVFRPVEAGDVFFAGRSLPLYHYGIYLVPALLQVLFDLSGLAVACAFLLPLGLLLACSGALSLAVRLGGLWAGLLALALLLLVPVGASYGLNNGFFNFHWLTFTEPGTGYGLAVTATALVLVERAYVDRRSAAIIAAFLVLALFQIRAQHFVLLVPPFVAFAILMVPATGAPHWRRMALTATIVSLGALVLLWAWPGFLDFISFSGATEFQQWSTVLREIDNSVGYRDLYQYVSSWPWPEVSIVRAVLLFPLIFGYLFFALPVMMLLGTSPRLRRTDLLFLLLSCWQLVLLAFAPAGQNGDAGEYAWRPFTVVYMLGVVLVAAHAVRAWRLRATLAPLSGARFAGAATLVAVSAVVVATATAYDPARGFPWWTPKFYRPVVDRGLIALARDLKARVAPGEVVAVGPINPEGELVDNGIILASLTGRAVYLTVPGDEIKYGGRAEEAKRRLQAQRDAENAMLAGSSLPARWSVDWYVDTGHADSHARADGAVFANSFGRIYRIKR